MMCDVIIFSDWLVDIGLPQYRDNFLEALVDGNVLNQITYVRENNKSCDRYVTLTYTL